MTRLDLTSKIVVRQLLGQQDIRPSKRLGQIFLISKNVLKKIIKTSNLHDTDIVLEIGAGIGTLTQELAAQSQKAITIEKDKRLVSILQETMKDFKNVEIIQEDILKLDLSKFINKDYKIIANLPYYITSPVIRKFLESETPPKIMILMVQKEVAQRICASPPKMNLLAITVQFYAKPSIVSYVPKTCFWPQPKVDSAIISIRGCQGLLSNQKELGLKEKDLFFKIVKTGFSHPRKQLINNLSKELALSSLTGVRLDKEAIRFWLLENKIRPEQKTNCVEFLCLEIHDIIKQWSKKLKKFFFSACSF